ncbi:MAG TPA: substrate-binding domain-containing protein [Baekduia sp.]|nr:substrate-binding domain-containing protein [Baekduia sp.]
MLVMSACGSSSDDAKSSGSSTSASTSAEAPDVAAAKKNVEAAYAATAKGFDPVGPPAQKGKNVLYLSAGTSSPDGTYGVAEAKKAAKALGWNLKVFDGKFSPQVYQEGIRQAISQKVDGLLMYGIDCGGNKKALQEAQAAGIKVSAMAGVDCNETKPGDASLFEANASHPGGKTDYEFYQQNGAIQADWIIAKTNGKAKVIEFAVPSFQVTAATQKGFEAELAKCSGCKIVETVDVGVDDFGPQLQEKAQQALLKQPDANAVAVSYDDLLTLGVAAAVAGSGHKDQLNVIAGNGSEPAMDLIRKDKGNNAGYVIDVSWTHFAGADALNRLFAGEKITETGEPVTVYDKDHNLAASGKFVPKFDFEGAFEKVWSGGGGQ